MAKITPFPSSMTPRKRAALSKQQRQQAKHQGMSLFMQCYMLTMREHSGELNLPAAAAEVVAAVRNGDFLLAEEPDDLVVATDLAIALLSRWRTELVAAAETDPPPKPQAS